MLPLVCRTRGILNCRKNGLSFLLPHPTVGRSFIKFDGMTRDFSSKATATTPSGGKAKSSTSAASKAASSAKAVAGAIPQAAGAVFSVVGRLVLGISDLTGAVIGHGRNVFLTAREIGRQVKTEHKISLTLDQGHWRNAVEWTKSSVKAVFERGVFGYTWGDAFWSLRVILGLFCFYYFGFSLARAIKEVHTYFKRRSIYSQRKKERLEKEAAAAAAPAVVASTVAAEVGETTTKPVHEDHHHQKHGDKAHKKSDSHH